jgi:HK97 family phage portal protein
MSLLSRFTSGAFLKINNERLPISGSASFLSGGGNASAGGQTQQLAAMTSVGWLFATVNRIAQSIAAQEWKLYRKQRGDRDEVDVHPALDLWHAVNPFITREDFLETSQQHMELTGEMWWVLIRNGAGIPVEMQVVRPDRMTPIPHPTEFIQGYQYQIGTNKITLDVDDVIFTRNPSPLDPYRGVGVVQSMMVDLGAERMAAQWQENFFRNSAEPGGIIEFPAGLSDQDFERLASRWRWQHQGTANAHRVAILERGTWKDRKITHTDMEFAGMRKFSRDQILGAFGMPLPIMGITESVNRANAEAAEVMYARWLVRPRLLRIRAALNEKLLKLYPDGDSLMFDFVDPVPDNRLELINEGQLGYQHKILTLNEARRRFGEDDWDGPEGDDLMSSPPPPMMQLPPPPAPDEEEPDEDEPEDEDAEEAGYKPGRKPRRSLKAEANDEYTTAENREVNAMERGWKRRLRTELNELIGYLEEVDKAATIQTKLTPDAVADYNWNWWAKYGDEVVGELSSAFSLVLRAASPDMPLPELQRLSAVYAERRGASLLKVDGSLSLATMTRSRVNTLVAGTIERGESLGTLQKALRSDLSFSADRARMVARTETASALGQGHKQAARAEGRAEKRWVTQADSLVNPEICDANSLQDWIAITDDFQSGHDTIPGHVNCRCVVQYRDAPISEQDGRSFIPEVRCPECNRKGGENVAVGTQMKCRRCKHEWELHDDELADRVLTG